jgi:hypothetical protein
MSKEQNVQEACMTRRRELSRVAMSCEMLVNRPRTSLGDVGDGPVGLDDLFYAYDFTAIEPIR